MARNRFKARLGRGAKNAQKAQGANASDITPMLMTGMVLGATAGDSQPKGDGMNEGDYRSGSDGYSPNTAYPDSQYGSLGGYDGGFDGGGDGGGGGD